MAMAMALCKKSRHYRVFFRNLTRLQPSLPHFFIEHFEKLAALITCSEPEKLMSLKSRIRGEALSQLINCPDLTQDSYEEQRQLRQEDNYEEFKIKFLAFFDKKKLVGHSPTTIF